MGLALLLVLGIALSPVQGAYRQELSAGTVDLLFGEPPLVSFVESTIECLATDTVADVNVFLQLAHQYVGDIDVSLISPSGTEVILIDGSGFDDIAWTITYDDSAPLPLTNNVAATAEYHGYYKPVGSLAAFNGESAVGDWVLQIVDTWPSLDYGGLHTWSLELTLGTSTCGDGIVADFAGEACDAGGATGCEADCSAVADGYVCDLDVEPSDCNATACGDGVIEGSEECDDGNTVTGDGCDNSTCAVTTGYGCTDTEPSVCVVSSCGDGLVTTGEACDDGDTDAGDGCSATCTVESGYTCVTSGAGAGASVCKAYACGNGFVDPGEECDDGNSDNWDACDNSCDLADICGPYRNYTATSGVLYSNEHSPKSPAGVDCVFVIAPPGASYIVLDAEYLAIAASWYYTSYSFGYYSTTPADDRILVYDGDSADADLLEIITNVADFRPVVSSGGAMTVVFERPHGNNYGMVLSYWACVEGTVVQLDAAVQPAGHIVSAACPDDGCSWRIFNSPTDTVSVGFTHYNLSGSATLKLYGGGSLAYTWDSTTELPPIVKVSSPARLVLTKDCAAGPANFTATYAAGACPNGGPTRSTALSGSFDDGSGIGNYLPGLSCEWHIAPDAPDGSLIKFTFTYIALDLFDTLALYDGPSREDFQLNAGSSYYLYDSASYVAWSQEVFLVFTSYERSLMSDGFAVSWQTITCPATWFAITDSSGRFGAAAPTSSGSCRWTIGSADDTLHVYVNTLSLGPNETVSYYNTAGDLETYLTAASPSGSYLSIAAGPINIQYDYLSLGSSFIMSFQSGACNYPLAIEGTTAFLTDGSGSGNYADNTLCYWMITPPNNGSSPPLAIELDFDTLSIEPSWDVLLAFASDDYGDAAAMFEAGDASALVWSSEGGEKYRLSGGKVNMLESAVVLVFATDSSVTYGGFDVTYTALYECPVGSVYNSSTGMCDLCPHGSSSLGGTEPCTPCPAGQYAVAGMPCTDCPGGRYAATTGRSTCTTCGAGRETGGSGSSTCTDCSAGTYAATSVTSVCSPCPVGEAQSATGATDCDVCLAGTAGPSTGLSTCVDCGNGTYSIGTGATQCTACSEGTAINFVGATSCNVCPTGTFAEGTGSSSCELCPRGEFNILQGRGGCLDCPRGSYAKTPGLSSCRECGVTTYSNETGASACYDCPDHSETRNPGAMFISSCRCLEGYYHSQLKDNTCNECPHGGYCAGGDSDPVALPGYWMDSPKSGWVEGEATFVQCEPPEACEGGADSACADGYVGFRCGACAVGSYYRSDKTCQACPSNPHLYNFLFALSIILPIALVIFLIRSVSRSFRSGSAAITYDFVQTASLCAGFQLGWPGTMSQTWNIMSTFYLNLDLLQTECTLQAGYTLKYYVTLTLPILFALVFVVVYLVALGLKRTVGVSRLRWIDFMMSWNFFVNGYLMFLSVFHPFLTGKAIEPFVCTQDESGNRSFMNADPTFYCFEDQWYSLLPMSLFAMVAYVIGIPVGFFVLLYKNRDRLDTREFKARYGSLYIVYRKDVWYWELVVKARKLLLQLCVLFFPSTPSGLLWQAVVGVGVLFSSVYVNNYFEPFRFRPNTRLQFVAAVANLFFLFTGLLYYSDKMSAISGKVLITLTLIVLFAVLIYLVVGMTAELAYAYKWKVFKRSAYSTGVGGGNSSAPMLTRNDSSFGARTLMKMAIVTTTRMNLHQEQMLRKYFNPAEMETIRGFWQVGLGGDKSKIMEALAILDAYKEELERSQFDLYRQSLMLNGDVIPFATPIDEATSEGSTPRPNSGGGGGGSGDGGSKRNGATTNSVFYHSRFPEVTGTSGGDSKKKSGAELAVRVGGGGSADDEASDDIDAVKALSSSSLSDGYSDTGESGRPVPSTANPSGIDVSSLAPLPGSTSLEVVSPLGSRKNSDISVSNEAESLVRDQDSSDDNRSSSTDLHKK